MSKELIDKVAAKFVEAGCEKLPEGAMRDNCEKKSKGKDDSKEAAKGDVPEAFKKEWKNKDKDGDGKINEPKPEFLKKDKKAADEGAMQKETKRLIDYLEENIKRTKDSLAKDFWSEGYRDNLKLVLRSYEKDLKKWKGELRKMSAASDELVSRRDRKAGCEKLPEGKMRDNCEKKSKGGDDKKKESSEAPQGVVVAMTKDGKIEIFDAPTPKFAAGLKEALKANGGYQRMASGPNAEKRSVEELYGDFEQRWAAEGE